jgi:hypothetical protein
MTNSNQTWETRELIRWLVNDPALSTLKGMTAEELEREVKAGHAPAGFYKSFQKDPPSSYDDIDWQDVAERLNDE